MSASNIERFDELTGRVLAALYAAFPVPVALCPDLFVSEASRMDDFLGMPVATEEAEFCDATICWLATAGYLHFQERDPELLQGFAGVVLTAKGLELLKAIPDSLGGSFGERLRDAAAAEGREGLRALASQVLGAGIALMLN
ncbi:MAG TPA: hypothetical protein DCG67_05640 [Pseudomonas sp.]|uniref:hypothetical protein n=1 Tax=Stutzerimonas balearica TaxID=74829 RepID=UPI000C6625F3|nr:hypothetical protein [Phycisphaerae bacterium]HAF91228.1 hypothetical protein [Pseudomonas sp.]|tara:strand:+ start:370 stop:795 length:426 start_codon:yes stop_codon:yes gene_type:complete